MSYLDKYAKRFAGGIDKFGHTAALATGATFPVTLWELALDYTFPSDSGVSLKISSSSGADTQVISVEGLDVNFERQKVNVTLSGQTKVAITGTWTRVFRAWVTGSVNLVGQLYVYEDVAITAGVPDDLNFVRATVTSTEVHNQTLQAIYTVPDGDIKGALLIGYDINSGKISGGQEAQIEMALYKREEGQVRRVQQHISLYTGGNSSVTKEYRVEQFFKPRTDIFMQIFDVSTGSVNISASFQLQLLQQ